MSNSKKENKTKKKISLKLLIPLTFALIFLYAIFFDTLTWWLHIIALLLIVMLAVMTIFKSFLNIDLHANHEITNKFVAVEVVIFIFSFLVMVYLMKQTDVQTYQLISSGTITIMSLLLVTSIESMYEMIYESYVLGNKNDSIKTNNNYYKDDLKKVKLSGLLLLFYILTINLSIITLSTFNENLWKSYETLDNNKSHIEVKQDSKGQHYIDKSQTTFYLNSGDKVEIK